MRNLQLTLRGAEAKHVTVFADDKVVKTKRNDFGYQAATIQSENSTIHLRVETILELQNPMWFLWNILFFIISIFGLFDVRTNKGCTVVTYDATIPLSDGENKLDLAIDPSKNTTILAQTTCQIDEHQNTLGIDPVLRKRKKILTISKIITFFITVGVILTIIALTTMTPKS